MAVVYRTTGALDGADAGISVSLPTLEKRLSDWRSNYKCSFVGGHPRALPLVTMYFTQVVIAVDDLDTKTAQFPNDGFYLVEGLHAEQSGFLSAPEAVRTGAVCVKPWSVIEWPTVRATGRPDVYSVTLYQQELGEITACNHRELLDEVTKLCRRMRPAAP
jgi:hypothetical protein